ncbi:MULTISPECIES: TRAP transporter substrate-binding protein [Thalassospira]|uniref:TRAP transporter substrate-binding protein n=1 Tax=Thalassospira TaxID=168934 RepID=UPI0008DEA616|nr:MULTISPECIES: TRAP transporter substrate-binding protein [Thalassospira]MAB32356.1 C4-dicarboxylate ABC transporter [Thalassospira sp.]MDM7976190.1 TRAP transporter substrate-binding protein [Thalassospira xiamenensis]OHY98423.1 C4-dicarboxylate ABC transporter [Thalassospira sp. MIT1004]|tara:strand:+ start:171 stop:1229 length:1059 start_codon:yes stop_codon:yes gene_type:complete
MKPMKLRNTLLGLLAGATILAGAGMAHAADITLKVSHYLPPSHGFQKDFLESWGKELSEKTNGKVEVEIYDATSAFGKIDRQADQVRAGVMDMAVGLNGIPRDRYPAASIIELPFLVKYADSGSETLWTLYKEGLLGSDYKDFKLLALFTHPGGLIHTLDNPVRSLDDLKGLRLRTPSPAISAMLESFGASPVGLPPSAIYENLQKGNIEGLVATWDLVNAVKANELLKYHTDAAAYTAGFYFVMNQKKYDSLPDDVRAAIDEISGDVLVGKFGDWWTKWEAVGKANAEQHGNEIISIDDATRAKWQEASQPMIKEYLAGLKEKGVSDPDAIYKRAQELIAEFDAKYHAGDK